MSRHKERVSPIPCRGAIWNHPKWKRGPAPAPRLRAVGQPVPRTRHAQTSPCRWRMRSGLSWTVKNDWRDLLGEADELRRRLPAARAAACLWDEHMGLARREIEGLEPHFSWFSSDARAVPGRAFREQPKFTCPWGPGLGGQRVGNWTQLHTLSRQVKLYQDSPSRHLA